MHFSRTFPKALLVLLLVFCFLFIAAAPIYAQDGDSEGDSEGDSGGILEGIFGVLKHGLLGPLGGLSLILDKAFGVDVFDSIVGKTVGGVATGLAGAIVKIFAALINSLILITTVVLFEIGGELIGTALTFNSKIAAIAEGGYSITLGIANMLFIVALVVIAFATMLRQENFGYKKALPRVVIAALLINFGFFIVTKWFIAPVDQITTAINSATHLNPGSLGKLFSVDNLFGQFSSFGGVTSMTNNIADIAKSMMSILLAATFSFIGIISIFAMAIMLFIRGIALSILLILLPIAWVAWIFPNLKIPGGSNPWSMWWENFTRWLLFAPFAMFFLWLAISLASKGELFPDAGTSLYSAAGQMIVTAGLILGGLMVSNKMGIMGAGIALGAVAAGKVWAQGKFKAYSKKTGYEALKRTLDRDELKKMQTLGAGKGFFKRSLAAPIRAAARGATVQMAAMTKDRETAFLDKIKNLAPFEISDMYAGLSEEKRAYALRHMIDKGYDWELVPEARQDIIRWNKEGTFDANKWGLKKAELDLIDTGISPNALEVMEPYRPRLAKAIEEGDEEEIERIKYILGLEVEEVLRKDLNVVTSSGFGKLQRRTFSSNPPDEKRPGQFKVGYQMFGNDEVGATMATIYGGAEMSYVSHDRADTTRRLKGATRGDGARNLSQANAKVLETLQGWFVEPMPDTSGTSAADFRSMSAPAKIAHLRKHWAKIQARAKVEIERTVKDRQKELSLSDEDTAKALESELKKADRAVPEKLVADLQQLLDNTKGSSHTILAT